MSRTSKTGSMDSHTGGRFLNQKSEERLKDTEGALGSRPRPLGRAHPGPPTPQPSLPGARAPEGGGGAEEECGR